MSRERGGQGHFTGEIEATEALSAFRGRTDQAKPLTARDVEEETGWARRTVHNKLEELVEEGALETRKVGGRARVWWAPIPRSEAPLSLMGLTEASFPATVEEVLEHAGGGIPGRTDEVQQKRAEAVLTAYEFLQGEGSAMKGEIQQHTYEAHPIDDATESQSGPERQWVRYLRNGLRELPSVEPPTGSSRGWNFIDPEGELAQRLDVDVDPWVEDVEITGEGAGADRQRAMVQLAYEFIKEEGQARRADFEEALPEYTAHFSDFEGFWVHALRDALDRAPGVEPPEGGGATFRYNPDGGE